MGIQYIVKKNDTLSKIAQSHKTNVKTLTQLNDIADPNKIQVGQTIKLPKKSYSDVIADAKKKLETGTIWGTAWWDVKNAMPEIDNTKIDKDLNKDFWSKAGAFEKFTAKKEPSIPDLSFDIPIDTGIAQTTPSMILPEIKKEPDVKIIDLPEKDVKVEVVELEDAGKVEVIEPEIKAPKITVEKGTDKIKVPVSPKIPTMPKEDVSPSWAFLNKFISPDRLDKVEKGFREGTGDAVKEVADAIRVLNVPRMPYEVPKIIHERLLTPYYEMTVDAWADFADAALDVVSLAKKPYSIISYYKEGTGATGKTLAELYARRADKARREGVTEYRTDLFSTSGVSIDLNKVDPKTFYKDASGGVLVPVDTTTALEAEYGPALAKERAASGAALKKVQKEALKLIFKMGEEDKWAKEKLAVDLTGITELDNFYSILKKAHAKLSEEIYQSRNAEAMAIGEKVSANNTKAGKELDAIMLSYQESIAAILDFSFKDAPADIISKARSGFFDLIKDVDLYNEYVRTAKEYNDYNDILSTAVIDEDRAVEDYEKLREELSVLKTEKNRKFIEDAETIDAMSPVVREIHLNYYWENKKDIDRIYDIAKEMSDISAWMEINNMKATNAENRQKVLESAATNFYSNFADLVATREFGELISSYATEKGKDLSPLIGHINEFNKCMAWEKNNSNKIAEIAARSKTSTAVALLEMQALTKEINDFAKRYTKGRAELHKVTEELERLQLRDVAIYHKEKSEVNAGLDASRVLHPFKTWKIWGEHGPKEAIMEGVGKLFNSVMEGIVKGLEVTKISKATDILIGNEKIIGTFAKLAQHIKEDTLPAAAINIRNFAESIEPFAEYTGAHKNSLTNKMNNALFDKETLEAFNIKDSKSDVPARKFALWAMSWIKDVDHMPDEFKDMKTKHESQTVILPIDLEHEDKTYSIYDIIEEYDSEGLAKAHGLHCTKEVLIKKIIELNDFDKQGIDRNKIPAGTEVAISLVSDLDKLMQAKFGEYEKKKMYLGSDEAYPEFTTEEKCSLYDFIPRKDRDKIIQVAMINDLPGQGIDIDNIPIGTKLLIPRFDEVPMFLSWMAPEKQLKLLTRRPFWVVVINELAGFIGDPLNLVWPITAFKFGRLIDMAGGKTSRELMKLARMKSPTGKVSAATARALGGMDNLNELASRTKSLCDWTTGLTELLRLKPISNPLLAKLPDNTPFIRLLKPEFGLDDPQNLATLSVVMAKFRGITMSKMLPWFQKKAVDMQDIDGNAAISESLINTKNALVRIADANDMAKEIIDEAMTLFIDNHTVNRNLVMKGATEYTKGCKNIKDWVEAKGGTGRNKKKMFMKSIAKDEEAGLFKSTAELKYALQEPEAFYADFYRRNKDIRVIDIACEFMERTGLSTGEMRKLYEAVPDLEKMAVEAMEKRFIEYQEYGKFRAILHQERYTSLSPMGRMAFRELLQDPKTGKLIPSQKVFDATKANLIKNYPTHKDAVMRGIKAVEDYKAETEWIRKYQEGYRTLPGRENDKILIPVEKNTQVELRMVEVNTLPKELQDIWETEEFKRYQVLTKEEKLEVDKKPSQYEKFKLAPDPETGKLIFVGNRNAYRDSRLPGLVMDYGGVIPGKRLSMLYDTVIGKTKHSKTRQAVKENKLLSSFVDTDKYGREMGERITYGDILNTAFMDYDIGWFNNYFKGEKGRTFRKEFKNIMDKVVQNKKRKEFTVTKSIQNVGEDRYTITASNPHGNKMYNQHKEIGSKVSRYLNIEKFYEVVAKLQSLYDVDTTHSLYRQLHDTLTVLKRNKKIEPFNELVLFLMNIKGKNKRPTFLEDFPLIKMLLTDKKFSHVEMTKVVTKLRHAANKMVENKTNASIEAKAAGMTSAEIKSMKAQIRTSVDYWDGKKLSKEEMAKKLRTRLDEINEHLPKVNDKKFSTKELREYNKLIERDGFYLANNIIPEFFTYIGLEKVGKEALLDNIVKFSREINSKSLALVADTKGKSSSYILQVIDDARDVIKKSTDNRIAFLPRTQADFGQAAEVMSKKYGFKNDIIYRLKRTPDHERLIDMRVDLDKLRIEFNESISPEKKGRIKQYQDRRDKLNQESRRMEEQAGLSYAEMKSRLEKSDIMKPAIKKDIELEKMRAELLSNIEHNKREDEKLMKLISDIMSDVKLADIKDEKASIGRIIQKTGFTEKQINEFISRRKELAGIQKSEDSIRREMRQAQEDLKEAVAQGDISENAAVNDAKDRLILLQKELKAQDKYDPEDIKWGDVVAGPTGKLRFSKIQAAKKEVVDIDIKLNESEKLLKEISMLEREIKDIEADPEFLPDPDAHAKTVKPDEDITIILQNGTEKVIKNTEIVTASPHKILRNAIESRAFFEKDSFYGHLLNLKRKLEQGDKYIVVGEELPEKFLNDIAAVDLAMQLDNIVNGKYKPDGFGDKKALDKLYKLEIDVAEKEQAFVKQDNIIKKLKDIKVINKKIKSETNKKIKFETHKYAALVKDFNEALDRGNVYAKAIGVGELDKKLSKEGTQIINIKRRYQKHFDQIDKKEYEVGTTVITKDVIDTFNQVKARKIKDKNNNLIDNPDFDKVITVSDYTDYDKNLIKCLRNHPNHFIEDRDYVVQHIDDAIDNEISTADAALAIQDSRIIKSIMNTMLDKNYGLGISDNELLELLHMSFKLDLPTREMDKAQKMKLWDAYEKLFPVAERVKLEKFADKLEHFYRKKGKTDADKRRNEFWNDVATEKGQRDIVTSDVALEIKAMEASEGRSHKLKTDIEDYDPDSFESKDYEKFVDKLHEEAELADEMSLEDIADIADIEDIKDKIGAEHDVDIVRKGEYKTLPERKREFALHMAGLLDGIKQALGWADFSPLIGKDGKVVAGKWMVNSVRSEEALAQVQQKMLTSANGHYFDNDRILPSVKSSLAKRKDIYSADTKEFFELLPEVYGAEDAKSYTDFKMYKDKIEHVTRTIKHLEKQLADTIEDRRFDISKTKLQLDRTVNTINRIRQELTGERFVNGKKVPGYRSEIVNILSRFDPKNKYHIHTLNIYQLETVFKKMDVPNLKAIAKEVQIKIDKAKVLEAKLIDLDKTKDEITLSIKNKELPFDRAIDNFEFDIEKLKTETLIYANIDDVLSGTYKPEGKGILKVKEFTKEFVSDINKRLSHITDQRELILFKLSKVKKLDSKSPLIKRYALDLIDLDQETLRLSKMIKIAVPWNIAVVNGIKFTAKEIYSASKDIFLDSYKSKMKDLAKLLAKSKEGFDPPIVLKTHKKLDVYFPTVKLGTEDSLYLKPLDDNWFKEWYYNLDRKHPSEVTLPKMDWEDLRNIDLGDKDAAIKGLTKFFEKTEGHAIYPTIVDLGTELTSFINKHLPAWKNKVYIIGDDIIRTKLKSIIPGRGGFISSGELNAIDKLKYLFRYRQGVWLFGKNTHGITSKTLSNSFWEKALSKREVAAIKEIRKAHQHKIAKFISTENITSLPQTLPRNIRNESMKLIGADQDEIITKVSIRLNLDQAYSQSNRFTAHINILNRLREEKIGFTEVREKIIKSRKFSDKVFVVGGYESIIDDLTREAIDDVIKLKMEFCFAKKMTSAEESMYSYIKESGGKISTTKYDVSRNFKIGAKGAPGMVLFNHKRWLVNYKAKDRNIIYRKMLAETFDKAQKDKTPLYMDDNVIEFKSLKSMEKQIEKELSDTMYKEWVANESKLAPQFIKEDNKYKYNIEETLSRWVLLDRRDKMKIDFEKLSEKNMRMYRNNQIKKLRDYYGRDLYKWELDLIEVEVSKAEHITRYISNYVFKYDMPNRITNQIKTLVTEKLLYYSTLGAKNLDSSEFKANFYARLDDFLFVTTTAKDLTYQQLISRLKSFWIWNVLLLRPSWYLWNNLGDSTRGVVAVRDIKLMKDMQAGYLVANAKFLKKIGRGLTVDIRAMRLERQVRKMLTKLNLGIDFKKKTLAEIRLSIDKLGISKATMESIKQRINIIEDLRKYEVFDLPKEKMPFGVPSNKTDTIAKFNFGPDGTAITKAGEVIDQRTLEWITSSGLVQATVDPVFARRLIESMPEKTFWDRIFKRSRVFKGDIEMFASQLEEMRRQTMAFDLLFNKAYSIAQTEKLVKKWMFDYRDLTYAGRTLRTLFPFYTFHYKSLQLYFGILLKAGPGAVKAGQALIEAIDQEAAALPEWMKDRVELDFIGLKGMYLLPHFGIPDHFKMLFNPMEEFENMVQNPLKAMFGLGFGPFPSSVIQEITGEGYFDRTYTTDQLRELGWSMEAIADYKKKNKKESNADTDKFASWLITYSSSLFPYAGFLKKLITIEEKNTLRNISWHQSPRVRELFKLFGINIKEMKDNSLDDIAFVWNNVHNLPPAFVKHVYEPRLKEDNPKLYEYFHDYTAMSWLRKINKMDDVELKYKEGITKIEAVTKVKYYNMEDKEPGSGNVWLANNPIAQDIMDRYWATKGDVETYEAGLRKFEIGKVKSLVDYILGTLGTVGMDKIKKLDAAGIAHPFTKDLDQQKLYDDIYDMHGDLRIRSIEDLVVILEKYGVIKELAMLMDTSAKLDVDYKEYLKLSVKAKKEQRLDDARYYHIKAIIQKALPSNVDSMPDEEAMKYWDKWKDLKVALIDSNPKYKKRYEDDLPSWKKEYLEKNEYYLTQWTWLRREDRKEDEDYFVEFYSQPAWFQKWYFIKNPIKALFYPIVADYTQQIKVLVERRKETGIWDSQKHYEALDYIWKKQNALKAWDKTKPGVYNYIDKHRQVWAKMAEEDTKDYFDLFYQHEGESSWDAYREYYLSKPENEYKRITYPFMRTWTGLIEKDQKNDTSFSSEWFWSPNNAEARKLYGKHNLLTDGKTKLDYQQQWKDWALKLKEDRGVVYNLVLNSKDWFKNHYFENHPDRKLYYNLAADMQAIDDFTESLDMFFNPKNKMAIQAWERDKPGTIANKEFWRDYTAINEKDGRIAALDFYFDPKNKIQADSHERNNPGAHEAYSLWHDYAKLPSNTWEGRKTKRQFLRDNPKLKDWWNRNKEITIEEKEIIFKEEIYYTILDKVNAEGKGRQYYLGYFGAKAKAKQYLDDNSDLKAARELRFRLLEPIDKTIQKLLEEYNKISLQVEKNQFLKDNKELDTYFFNTVPPGIRKVWLLQRSYFNIDDNDPDKQRLQRQAFLSLYPELTEYWDISRLPVSYFTDKTKFETYQTQFNKANDYFEAVRNKDWKLADKIHSKLSEFSPDIRTEEGRWLLSKLYNTAMSVWATTFGTYMSTYYFRSLPSWLRNEYYRKHPKSKIISYTPMSKSLNNAVIIENSKHPDLVWARRMMQKYGKDLPAGINKQVQKIMVKWGEWESRSTWTSAQWSNWWLARSARVNGLRQKDLDEIPLLKKELARAQKMFSYSMLPFSRKKYGIINPFIRCAYFIAGVDYRSRK